MVDSLSPVARSERMSRIKGRDSAAEIAVRRLVHALGFRYRLHHPKLPGRPDLAFPKYRKVIFVHGCFWHRHDDPCCKLARLPKSRLDFWLPKLEGNRARDERREQQLHELGWGCLVVWECQVGQRERLKERIRTFLLA